MNILANAPPTGITQFASNPIKYNLNPKQGALVACWGVFGGAEVRLEISPDGKKWLPLDEAKFTTDGLTTIAFTPLLLIRGVVINATATTSVNLAIT